MPENDLPCLNQPPQGTAFHVLFVEDPRHVWGKRPGSPVLQRVIMPNPLPPQCLMPLLKASAFRPVDARLFGLGEWCTASQAFRAHHIALDPKPSATPSSGSSSSSPAATTRPRRRYAAVFSSSPMPNAAATNSSMSAAHPIDPKGSRAHTSTAQMAIISPHPTARIDGADA